MMVEHALSNTAPAEKQESIMSKAQTTFMWALIASTIALAVLGSYAIAVIFQVIMH